MKKYLLLFLLFSLVIFGCAKQNLQNIDVSSINDLATLEAVIVQVSQDIKDDTLSIDQAQNIVKQLQQKYIDLTDITEATIETKFGIIQKSFEEKSVMFYGLPLRAKRLGMMEPVGMNLNTSLSTYVSENASGYSSTTLVYTGDYQLSLEQAKNIAQQAHLFVTRNFQQAQSLAKIGNIDYISGLDIGNVSKGIIYVNHELLDTNMENLLSVSVDQYGTLTIEATKYQN